MGDYDYNYNHDHYYNYNHNDHHYNYHNHHYYSGNRLPQVWQANRALFLLQLLLSRGFLVQQMRFWRGQRPHVERGHRGMQGCKSTSKAPGHVIIPPHTSRAVTKHYDYQTTKC